jgi:hypothetical protein
MALIDIVCILVLGAVPVFVSSALVGFSMLQILASRSIVTALDVFTVLIYIARSLLVSCVSTNDGLVLNLVRPMVRPRAPSLS